MTPLRTTVENGVFTKNALQPSYINRIQKKKKTEQLKFAGTMRFCSCVKITTETYAVSSGKNGVNFTRILNAGLKRGRIRGMSVVRLNVTRLIIARRFRVYVSRPATSERKRNKTPVI